jgi:signal transduction histidine kinase
MTNSDATRRSLRYILRSEWTELGALGRTALIATAVSALVAVALAVAIPNQVQRHLIDTEVETLTATADELTALGAISTGLPDVEVLEELDDAVRLNLLGAGTIRVKVWLPDGTIAYSDEAALVGQRFALSDSVLEAFTGTAAVSEPDLSRPENAFERGHPALREYYLPATTDSGAIVGVFEVYQLADHVNGVVGAVRRYVWLSIAIGFALLSAFLAILIIVNGRAAARRSHRAEQLFADLVAAQAAERTRIIGALHDDIGQTLVRVHFGLEDLSRRAETDPDLAGDLDRLNALVRDVDGALRGELRSLRHGTGEELELATALVELAEVTEMETDLQIDVSTNGECPLSESGRIALFRAGREAIMNVRKHAHATHVEISVRQHRGNVLLEVVDDGSGMTGEPGLGITTMKERLEAIGGGIRLGPGRRGGTRIRAWVPAEDGFDR